MKHLAIFISTVSLITTTLLPVAQGQTRRTQRKKKPTSVAKPINKTANSTAAVTTPSGLVYIITKHNNGRYPVQGETVVVNYTGLLSNGVKFDSSFDRGQPFKFKLGLGRVIKGWDEGIQKIRVGEQATLVIPASLGYGAEGSGDVIPPNATLIFVVELLDIESPKPANESAPF